MIWDDHDLMVRIPNSPIHTIWWLLKAFPDLFRFSAFTDDIGVVKHGLVLYLHYSGCYSERNAIQICNPNLARMYAVHQLRGLLPKAARSRRLILLLHGFFAGQDSCFLQDGWGSYPDQLQNCPIFQHAYKIGRRFYLAFQQHTNLALAHQQANLFGRGESYSLIRLMGSNVALVAPDVRAERTRSQVVSPESWQMIFDRVAALPGSVRHIVLLTTIPVVYPKVYTISRKGSVVRTWLEP